MASLQKNRRDRLPTIVYDDNYGYTFNFYKPMIDYLDSKQQGNNPQYPHLPYSNERGLREFRSKNTVKPYTSEDIEKYSELTSEQAKRDLDDFRVCKRSAFSVIKTADTSRLVKHLKGEGVLEKSARKNKERAIVERAEIKEEQKKLKKMLEEARHQEFSTSLKKAIRGKSSNEICDAILAESKRNIKTNDETEYHEIMRREQRGFSEKRIVHTAHIEWMDDRLAESLNQTVTGTLGCVKRDLMNFSSKSTNILNETRWLFTDL